MEIISKTTKFQLEQDTAVVLGKFDGVHLGHQKLLKELKKAKTEGLQTVVFTFDKSPASLFIQEGNSYRELSTLEEKRDIFADMGVDVLIEFPMDEETCRISALDFIIDIIQKQLRCKKIIAGEDVSFGYKGLGDSNLLLECSAKLKEMHSDAYFDVKIIEKFMLKELFPNEEENQEISSTLIRRDLELGKIQMANKCMGRPFSIRGEVIPGKHLGGKVFEMPTANIVWPENKIMVKAGVYYTKVCVNGCVYDAITNVGYKPTVMNDRHQVLAETYIYEFDSDIYGQEIEIYFYEFVRPEQRFESFELLKEQLKQDKIKGKNYWKCSIL